MMVNNLCTDLGLQNIKDCMASTCLASFQDSLHMVVKAYDETVVKVAQCLARSDSANL